MEASNTGTVVPEYINFLLDPSTPLDFKVNVKNPDGSPSDGMKAVKWMLIARSKVMRVMLLQSELKHDNEFTLTDIDCVTFKHFLVFLYGHDQISSLSLEDALNLLYAAEKYDVEDMKDRLGTTIKPQVNIDNIFIILRHAPVCEKSPALWESVTEIIQYRTEEIFKNEQEFVRVSREVLLHIVQQDQLSVPEIEVWRAALTWARHQDPVTAAVVSPDALRSTMLPFLKHIRLCTLSTEELCSEVLPTEVLTTHETTQVSTCIEKQEKADKLIYLCNEIEKRQMHSIFCTTCVTNNSSSQPERDHSYCVLLVKAKPVELCGVKCLGNAPPNVNVMTAEQALEYRCQCTVEIRNRGVRNDNSPEPNIVIEFDQMVEYDKLFLIPLEHDNKPIVLKANNPYAIIFRFHSAHRVFNPIESQCEEDIVVLSLCHFKILYYKMLDND